MSLTLFLYVLILMYLTTCALSKFRTQTVAFLCELESQYPTVTSTTGSHKNLLILFVECRFQRQCYVIRRYRYWNKRGLSEDRYNVGIYLDEVIGDTQLYLSGLTSMDLQSFTGVRIRGCGIQNLPYIREVTAKPSEPIPTTFSLVSTELFAAKKSHNALMVIWEQSNAYTTRNTYDRFEITEVPIQQEVMHALVECTLLNSLVDTRSSLDGYSPAQFTCISDGYSSSNSCQTFTDLPRSLKARCSEKVHSKQHTKPLDDNSDQNTIYHVTIAVQAVVSISIIIIILVRKRLRNRNSNTSTPLLTLVPNARRNRVPKFIAFLAYCDKDYDFAITYLYPKLERQLKQILKHKQYGAPLIIVNDRHFHLGKDLDTLVSAAIVDSYVTLAIVSDSFLQSTWCQYEILKSFNENVPVLPLYRSKIDRSLLTGPLRELFDSRTRIVWPDGECGKDRKGKSKSNMERDTIIALCINIVAHVEQCKQGMTDKDDNENEAHIKLLL